MEGYYYCRHCGGNVGSINAEKVYSDVLFQLTEQEVVEMIHFHENGNIYIKTICESCQETLASYPEYYDMKNFCNKMLSLWHVQSIFLFSFSKIFA